MQYLNNKLATSEAMGIARLFNSFGPRIALAPETGAGSGETGEEATQDQNKSAEQTATEETGAEDVSDKAGSEGDQERGMSDAEAKLLKELMKVKGKNSEWQKKCEELDAKLKEFSGVDVNEYRNLAEAKRQAEISEAEQRGEFDRVRQMMADDHKRSVEALQSEIENLKSGLKTRDETINELTIGSSFANSSFIKDSLTLTPSKARIVYGNHFSVENGKIVAFDKPNGSADRTPLVNANNEPLNFEAALKRLVDLDPEREAILRNKASAGAGSATSGEKSSGKLDDNEMYGISRIGAALQARTKKS